LAKKFSQRSRLQYAIFAEAAVLAQRAHQQLVGVVAQQGTSPEQFGRFQALTHQHPERLTQAAHTLWSLDPCGDVRQRAHHVSGAASHAFFQ
jgi:hypothetical protein